MTAWVAEHLIWVDDREVAGGDALRLNALRCAACGRCSFPSTGSCTWCGAAGTDEALATTGEVVAATAVLHATPGAVVDVPYIVALLRFDDAQVDVLGRLVGTDDLTTAPPGTQLQIVAETLPDGRRHYAYARPLEAK